ncbi:DUF1963 domain-containing protein [Bradyrhizobium jicamae]|uniref:DUF1963 domain-containing protein n=1 Tax=Bradyrhizobium jicamae TaxID=280332 RepID=UPI001BA5DDF6|nr:DUF1963 domain-containing protein [Bradyrhizobium jicamae]MBR0756428.1 DUF1963 domain-containing protein [Bradyrhizobium jicamae]
MASDVILLERYWPPATAPADTISQLGGWPNLPADWPWPRIQFEDGSSAALDFVAQIDLAGLPTVSQRSLLPATGTLYFFVLSQSNVPLHEYGPEAARVLYYPGDARDIPRRAPPPDAGWGLGDLDYAHMHAAEFRNTDAPPGDLFPRCPLRARAALIADEPEPRQRRTETGFEFRDTDLPFRVEDALLHINFARNDWSENILPFSTIRSAAIQYGEEYLEFEKRPSKWEDKLPRPAYIDNVVSPEFWLKYEREYADWRQRAIALWHQLTDLGRATILDSEHRASVVAIVAEADALREQITRYGLGFSSFESQQAAKISLATLLIDHPETAIGHADEVLAAHPTQSCFGSGHRMLGPPNDIQGETMTGPEPVLLLQLDTDPWGPRFCWWDAGNLTFWISATDAAAGRFELARAEIEGH